MKKNVIFQEKEKHSWGNVYFKNVTMVTKQKILNMISSFNLNSKCKILILIFFVHTVMTVQLRL